MRLLVRLSKIFAIVCMAVAVLLLVAGAILTWYLTGRLEEFGQEEAAYYEELKQRALPVEDGASLARRMWEYEEAGRGEKKFVGVAAFPGEQRQVFVKMNAIGDRVPGPEQMAAFDHLRDNYRRNKQEFLGVALERYRDFRGRILETIDQIPSVWRRLFMPIDFHARLPDLATAADFDGQEYEIWAAVGDQHRDGQAFVVINYRSPDNFLFSSFIVVFGDRAALEPETLGFESVRTDIRILIPELPERRR